MNFTVDPDGAGEWPTRGDLEFASLMVWLRMVMQAMRTAPAHGVVGEDDTEPH